MCIIHNIYIYIHTHGKYMCIIACRGQQIRPITLLRFSLLRFLDSEFLGDSLWTGEFHPVKLRLCLSQTL